jgi:hypothetical protein
MAAVSIPEGASVSNNVMIFAEELVLYRGSKFEWPSKNVTIFARRIIIAPRYGETLASNDEHFVKFDCSGTDATDSYANQSSTAATNGSDGENGSRSGNTTAGVNGTNGKDGGSASPGGTIRVCAQLLTLVPEAEDKTLRLVSKGGNGGRGQQGGKGGKGSNGVKHNGVINYPIHQRADASNGGDGGSGGGGGDGANGGLIDFCRLVASVPMASSRFRSVPLSTDVQFGINGVSGTGGDHGPAGEAGYVYYVFYMSAHSYRGKGASDGSCGTTPTTNTSTHSAGTVRAVSYNAASLGAWALCISPALLQMLVQRLLFEYDVLFGNFFDVEPGQNKSLERLRFERSFSWLMSLNDDIKKFETSADLAFKYTPSKPDTPAEEKNQEEALRAVFGGTTWQHDRQLISARRIARISFDKLCSLGGDELPPIPSVDSYDQSFRLVPNVGISIKRLEQAAKAMESVKESS